LVRRICTNCREEFEPSDGELEGILLTRKDAQGKKFYRGRGCAHCRNTGYYGRTGIFEILEMKQNIRKLVFDNHNQEQVRALAIANGMDTLRDAALKKIFTGVTTIQEMMRVTVQEY